MSFDLAEWWLKHCGLVIPTAKVIGMQCMPEYGDPIYIEVTSIESVPNFTRGPRKGSPNYGNAKGKKRHAIQLDQVEQIKGTYELSTGKCVDCFGSGKVIASISCGSATYNQCGRCRGAGQATKESIE